MSVIFFDLDDTIYDRGVPFRKTFAHFFGSADEQLAKQAYKTCSIRSNEVFEDSQKGRITMEEMYIYRYQRGLADVGITVTDEQALAYQKYYGLMQHSLEMTSTMERILNLCLAQYDAIGIITNGPGGHQREKLTCLGMERWVRPELIFISGEHGITKPDPRIFAMARSAAGISDRELIYVGDSYDTDIAAPAALGWTTIWLNKKGEPVPEGHPAPTHIVPDEEGLLECLSRL